MIIQLLSDLHLESWPFGYRPTDADVVVLAGDIAVVTNPDSWRRFEQLIVAIGQRPIIYVPGNHESYGGSWEQTERAGQDLQGRYRNVHFLAEQVVEIAHVRFFGSLWGTGFRLPYVPPSATGQHVRRVCNPAAASSLAGRFIRDFAVTQVDGRLLVPGDYDVLHDRARQALLAADADVVVTHFMPDPIGIASPYADSPLNPYFCSDDHALLMNPPVRRPRGPASPDDLTGPDLPARSTPFRLWLHGHTHSSVNAVVGGTPIRCNPRGYNRHENSLFDPTLTITLPT